MLSTSFDYRAQIAQNSKVVLRGDLTLADGTTEQLAGDDFMMGSAAFSDAVSSSGSFDIGAAIINSLRVSLNNYDGRFDDYDFTDATIVPYVGVQLSGGTVEWLRMGVYGVEQPRTYGTIISISALDNMRKLERPYSDVSTTYPATLQTIVRDICSTCGVTLVNPDFANGSYVVAERPDDSSLTCIAALSYAAQASGNWARCDEWGRVRLGWYDTTAFEGEDWLDGDRFDGATPYASGDAADGNDLPDYTGGAFGTNRWAHVFAISSSSICTDDVVITGLRVTAQDKRVDGGTDLDGETYLYGSEGYVIEIHDNPMVQYGKAHDVAAQVGVRVVGMRFRPFELSAVGDPALEAGDPVVITDASHRQYLSYLTSLTYKVGAYESMACDAETPSRNRAASYSALTETVVKLRNSVKRERTEREVAIANLAEELAGSSGFFTTAVPQQDGSTIYYAHDKPTLAESVVVWKFTADAMGISTDGGQTYPYGLDVSGTAILNKVYAIGINADYIDSGALTVTDGNVTVLNADADTGVVVLRDSSGNYWNLHTGELRMTAASQIGGKTAQQVLEEMDAAITSVDVEYAQNQSSTTAPTAGWQTTAPVWQAGYYIWQRTVTTNAAGTNYSDPVCISGRDGASGTNASTLYLYQRSSTAPAKPTATLTYTFSTGDLSGSLGNWSRGIPDGADTCWVIVASAISNSSTDTIAPSEWSDPVELAAGGVDGLNQAFIYLHKRAKVWGRTAGGLVAPSASAFSVSGTTATVPGTVSGTTLTIAGDAPAAPSGNLTYTFATGALSGNLEGWSRGVPDGDDPCWVTTAVAISSEGTDTIGPNEWAEVVKLVEDGVAPQTESVAYAVSATGDAPPEVGWQPTVPTVAQGMWLWCRTTYTDGSDLVTCSYMGTDGQDGISVAVQSVTKADGVTTVVLASSDGTTDTLRIADGDDGPTGVAGQNGYMHVAWATSADGTQGFSTSVSAGKTYIGVYTDHAAADSSQPSDYSWSKIKGETGTGVSAVVEQYYLSTSSTTQVGGSWGTDQPTWVAGRHIWTRSAVTWTDGRTTYTEPILAKAVNGANETAKGAADAVTALDESLTQREIFDRLTNGGETQGIYLQDGRLYINGTYIKSGTIDGGLIRTGLVHFDDDGYINFQSGEMVLGSTSVMGDRTVAQVLGAVDATITDVDVEYARSQSRTDPPTTGWGTTAPAWQAGWYIWSRTATTTAAGTTRSDPVCISGRDGTDGRGISSTATSYGVSNSGTTQPSSWQSSVPSVGQGRWLWARTVTTYTDNTTSTAYAKSYVGTDGQDGKSVVVSDASKVGKVTTVTMQTIQDGVVVGTDILTISDGSDGQDGIAGANGYVHVAWANSADGTQGFSTSDSANKRYLGVYTDGTSADSTSPSAYSWSLIKGADGTSVTVSKVEYGTSTSASTQPGSWSQTVPTSIAKGRWLWVKTTYSDGSVATTKSYVGTDGQDGKSVYVQSSSKSGGTTTVVLTDGTTTNTLTISDGEDGDDGTPGTNGLNGYVHVAWATSADGSQGFSTSVSANKTYIGVYTDNTQADSQSYADYSWSLIKGADGAAGANGYNTATIVLYQRAASQPAKPSSSLTYTFASHALSGSLGGWSTSIPSGSDPCWVTAATATATTATDTIAASEWTTPVKLVQNGANGTNGTNGANGTNGLNQATVFLYQRAASQPSKPSTATTYTFATGALSSVPSGWSRGVPTANGSPCWVTTAAAISNGTTDSIAAADWSTPTKMAEDGTDGVGVSLIVEQYYLSTSDSTLQDGTWTATQPTWVAGRYIWTRSEITWTDGTMTHTTPVLASALNDVSARSTENAEGIEGLQGDVGELSGSLDNERQQRASESASLSQYVYNLEDDLDGREAEMRDLIDEARRYATDYLKYQNGELTLGATDSAIRQVLTNAQQVYRTDSGDVAWFGLNASGIWEMHIQTASVNDRLSFGDFSWIARQNGNMTLKWVG